MLVVYAGAEFAELYDNEIFEWIGFSGHSFKHIIAAFGAYLFSKGLEVRKPKN